MPRDPITGDQAEAAGRAAYKAGLPCDAPDYGREDRRARWRIGWKKERWAMGVRTGATIALPSEREADELFRQHGGRYHGPHVETATITQRDFYRFCEALILRASNATLEAMERHLADAADLEVKATGERT